MSAPPFKIVRVVKGGGYRYARTEPRHPKATPRGLYPLHRVLVENREGRLLRPGEVVHHRDGDRTNDSVDNLELLTNAEHARHHQPERPPLTATCGHCGEDFATKASVLRRHVKASSDGQVYCSRSCSALRQMARAREASSANHVHGADAPR